MTNLPASTTIAVAVGSFQLAYACCTCLVTSEVPVTGIGGVPVVTVSRLARSATGPKPRSTRRPAGSAGSASVSSAYASANVALAASNTRSRLGASTAPVSGAAT